jgi:hypothetical protein
MQSGNTQHQGTADESFAQSVKLKDRAIGRSMNPSSCKASDSDASCSTVKAGLKTGTMAAILSFGMFAHGGVLAAENPFAHLAGSWAGQGKITVKSGGSERIRCRGSYRAGQGGTTLTISLRCASDSYKFELASDVTYDNGNISGSWNESSRQVYGQLSGRATANNISAQASAVGVSAGISIATRGNSQTVVIRSPGSEISEISVTMARAGR